MYWGVFIISRIARPNLVAKSSLCDTAISCQYGFLPRAHAGKYVDVISDLLERGATKTMSLSFSLLAIFMSSSHRTLWCGPILNEGFISITNANKSSLACLTASLEAAFLSSTVTDIYCFSPYH